jgi:hypothetical protein
MPKNLGKSSSFIRVSTRVKKLTEKAEDFQKKLAHRFETDMSESENQKETGEMEESFVNMTTQSISDNVRQEAAFKSNIMDSRSECRKATTTISPSNISPLENTSDLSVNLSFGTVIFCSPLQFDVAHRPIWPKNFSQKREIMSYLFANKIDFLFASQNPGGGTQVYFRSQSDAKRALALLRGKPIIFDGSFQLSVRQNENGIFGGYRHEILLDKPDGSLTTINHAILEPALKNLLDINFVNCDIEAEKFGGQIVITGLSVYTARLLIESDSRELLIGSKRATIQLWKTKKPMPEATRKSHNSTPSAVPLSEEDLLAKRREKNRRNRQRQRTRKREKRARATEVSPRATHSDELATPSISQKPIPPSVSISNTSNHPAKPVQSTMKASQKPSPASNSISQTSTPSFVRGFLLKNQAEPVVLKPLPSMASYVSGSKPS